MTSCRHEIERMMMKGLVQYRDPGESCGWQDKYRPTTLEEVLLPQSLKSKLLTLRENDNSPHLLFYGKPGTGKTTTALALNRDRHIFNTSVMDATVFASEEFRAFLATQSLPIFRDSDRRKVIILDEADCLTDRAQNSLRSILEEYADHCWFVLIGNDITRITAPIQSRTIPILLGKEEEKMRAWMEKEMMGRCKQILREEECEYPDSQLRALVGKHYPDMRTILKMLQFYATPATVS